jgi:hypothetical protein
MRILAACALLALAAGCAPKFRYNQYGRLGKANVECKWETQQRVYLGPKPLRSAVLTSVQCCVPGDPRTCKAMLVGELGPALHGELRGGSDVK